MRPQLHLLFLLSALATAQEKQFERTAQSRVSVSLRSDGLTQRVITNTSYSFANIWRFGDLREAILEQSFTNEEVQGQEGSMGFAEIHAWTGKGTNFDSLIWTIRVPANWGGLFKKYYRTSQYGCCAAENFESLFELSSGRLLMNFTGTPAFLSINTPRIERMFGYVSARSTVLPEYMSASSNTVGALTLVSENGPIDRVILDSPDADLADSPTITLEGGKIDKPGSDVTIFQSATFPFTGNLDWPEVVGNFSVRLTFYPGCEVIIPVQRDRFDLTKVKLPQGVAIARVPL